MEFRISRIDRLKINKPTEEEIQNPKGIIFLKIEKKHQIEFNEKDVILNDSSKHGDKKTIPLLSSFSEEQIVQSNIEFSKNIIEKIDLNRLNSGKSSGSKNSSYSLEQLKKFYTAITEKKVPYVSKEELVNLLKKEIENK